MGKAIFRGVQGLFLGYLVYLLFCFVFRVWADNGTGGCIAIITGTVFFVASLPTGKMPAVPEKAVKEPKPVENSEGNIERIEQSPPPTPATKTKQVVIPTPEPICSKCGNVGSPRDRFCRKCGNPLK